MRTLGQTTPMVDVQLPGDVTLTTGSGTYVEPRPEPRRLPLPTVAIFDRMSAAEYHADPCAEPSLSASIAGVLDRQSPAHAWLAHPRLGGRPRAPSEAMDRGTLVHALLLDEDESAIGVVHADDWRSKDARAEREAVRAMGLEGAKLLEAKLDRMIRENAEATAAESQGRLL